MGVLHVQHRSARQTARLRQIIVISALCFAIYCFLLLPEESPDSSRWTNPEAYQSRPQHQDQYQRYREEERDTLPPELLNNRFLTEDQCRVSFPGLLEQVDNEVAKGPFKLERYPSDLGPLVARIRDGQLYILSATRRNDLSREMLAHRSATLHQIANALLTWPRPSSSSPSPSSPFSHIPDTIFAFNHNDDPMASTFSYSRPADPALLKNQDGTPKRFFPVPHFSFYSWALPFIGSLPRASRAIADLESELPFEEKIPRAVWRGTMWFNNPRAGRLRQNLVRVFGNANRKPGEKKHWADIEALDWATKPLGAGVGSGERNASNALRIEEFCRYKYIIHTEGVTYSGRFQFHNLCASVVITPPVAWIQHVTHLLRPVFSYTLDPEAPDSLPSSSSHLSFRSLFTSFFTAGEKSQRKQNNKTPAGLPRHPVDLGGAEKPRSLSPYPAPWVRSAWPTEHDASRANIVFVAPDWSDLEATVAWLEAHPQIAEGIARRQRSLFEDGGYFSPAAEMCYWRGLIRGWSEVVRIDEGAFDDLEEMTWEEFSLKEIHK
ncbi:hypothetical protein HD806DRAFT_438423 [Xylariaceae sp. AK1471]|nr:hypothetical protein HD806DRAFT_438423 [Xylariaceae sp. AK1471]